MNQGSGKNEVKLPVEEGNATENDLRKSCAAKFNYYSGADHKGTRRIEVGPIGPQIRGVN